MNNIEKKELDVNFDPLSPDNIDVFNLHQRRDHELKINARYFKQIKEGLKRAEFRRADRDFQLGDFLTLREFNSLPPQVGYTGRTVIAQITDIVLVNDLYIELRGKPDFVMLSFSIIHIKE
ncbi:DUF3850 domain-containing protein [Providencia hangzhouensis]|uniref:DUF3850 domain-containing protein n=1 Tax=Providencia hangzhouensis TaxID=3031799 RepID=UPI0034DD4832